MLTYGLAQAPVFQEPGDICETSPFGMRTINGKRDNHKGVDVVRRYNGRNTTATIVAIAAGKVTAVERSVVGTNAKQSAGNYVVVDHGGGIVTKYLHLKYGSIPAGIVKGCNVAKGAVLGYMGSTGNSTAPHLHFQIEQNGVPVDGAPYLKGQKVIGGATADDYIKKIVAKVGYDDPASATAAFKKVQHRFVTDLWRKLWEAVK